MTDRQKARAQLLAEIGRSVRQEVRMELVLAGVSPVREPAFWDPTDRVAFANRLRKLADELDPPEGFVQ